MSRTGTVQQLQKEAKFDNKNDQNYLKVDGIYFAHNSSWTRTFVSLTKK